MTYSENQFIIPESLYWEGVLHDVSKSRQALQPIFEAFTNAIEAIKLKQQSEPSLKGDILINIRSAATTVGSSNFTSLSITDNGIGFDDEQFKRFNTFKDITKGFKNLGSGRIQYVHYFENSSVKSIYKQDGKTYEREFIVSKKKLYLDQNSIVLHKYSKEIENSATGTTISFNSLLENSNLFNNLDASELKEQLLKRYIHYFCHNKNALPKIEIKFYIQGELSGEQTISKVDIPSIHKTETINIAYKRMASNSKGLEETEKSEEFKIDAFKIPSAQLDNNDLKLVSKGEIVEESDVKLESLPKGENVKGDKYIFLIYSDYIDSRDTNLRGVLKIPTFDSLTKNPSFFTIEEIIIEDIQQAVNNKISSMYPEIEEVKKQHLEQLDKLKEMFLLDEETAKNINISINDSESKILEKFYEAEAKKIASLDASIKESIDNLDKLDTTSPNYNEELEKEIEKLVKAIPMQNKASLTHYVARRKIVLELFEKISKKQLSVQVNEDRNKDEKLLHNLIFQQTTTNSEESDLWLVNEDFIYFKGTSEDLLKDVQINGVNLLRENLTPEEDAFRTSLKENRYTNRPDILLFPDEGKCIIIEFKNPAVNVSDHLTQITNYASLIWNFAKPEFRFETFYGYLIGEKINPIDVRFNDGDFREAYHFDYLFRPHKAVPGFFIQGDASLYTEVIKYSTLLERAKRRNEIFIKKLGKS
ncbi:MAG: ATP-binding protein [Sphingobacteriales bacterium JAD_PAG50586_3]|nr:MAG: ATP-binding protein [Sphingobacteriales bacterium JAD_PAG50586_3]